MSAHDKISAKEKALILKAVADKHGQLTPDLLVREANPKIKSGVAHRLSDLCGWDKSEAALAQERRVDMARRVIRSAEPLLIQLGVVQIRAPQLVHDPRLQPGKQGYVPLLAIKSEREVAEESMQAEVDRAVAALKRAHSIALVLEMEVEAAAIYAALGELGSLAVLEDGDLTERVAAAT